jgi:hypothetical protein
MAQVQPRSDTHRPLSAAALGERALPQPVLLAANGEPSGPNRIMLPLEIDPSMKRPINLGWNRQTVSNACKNEAVNKCTNECADIGECIFGCEIGAINSVDTCNSSCTGLGTPCIDSCLETVNAISANCSPLTVTTFKVLFGSTAYTVSTASPAILPWQATGIQVTFSEPVVTGTINSLGGITATGFRGVGTNTLTWTFAPIATANITVSLATSGINMLSDSNTYALDNGAVHSQALKILAGDVNSDGVVNASDLVLVNGGTAQQYNILYDINGDGVVSTADVTAVKARLNTKLPTLQ